MVLRYITYSKVIIVIFICGIIIRYALKMLPIMKERHRLHCSVQRYWRNTTCQCERYTNIPTTTITDPVITYEKPIPTNSTAPKPTHSRRVGLYSIVEPNRRPPGHYNESKLDLLVTNGLFTIGSNWFYNLVFAA
jgi:hypothetical protein